MNQGRACAPSDKCKFKAVLFAKRRDEPPKALDWEGRISCAVRRLFSIGPCLAIRPGRRAASIRRLLETVPEHQRDAARKPAAMAAVIAAPINIVQPKRRLPDCSCSPNPNLRNDHFRVVTIPVVAQVLSGVLDSGHARSKLAARSLRLLRVRCGIVLAFLEKAAFGS